MSKAAWTAGNTSTQPQQLSVLHGSPSVVGYSSVKDTRRGVKPCLDNGQPADVRRQAGIFVALCLQTA